MQLEMYFKKQKLTLTKTNKCKFMTPNAFTNVNVMNLIPQILVKQSGKKQHLGI